MRINRVPLFYSLAALAPIACQPAPAPSSPSPPQPVVVAPPSASAAPPASDTDPEGKPQLVPQRGHREGIWSLAFTPDGKALVSGTNDHTVRVWDAPTGRLRAVFPTNSEIVHSVAVSPDSSRIVASGYMKARAWNPHSGAELPAYPSDNGWVEKLAFSPDGSSLASGELALVRLWDTAGAHEIARVPTARDDVRDLAWGPDGSALAYAVNREIPIYDVRSKSVRRTLGPHASVIFRIAWHPDGSAIVSDGNPTLTIWDSATGQQRGTIGKPAFAKALSFSPDGARLAVAVGDVVTLFDWKTGAESLVVKGDGSGIMSLAWRGDSQQLAAGSGNGSIRVWDARSGNPGVTMAPASEPIEALQSSPGSTGVLVTTRAQASYWDVSAGVIRATMPASAVACANDDGTLVAAARSSNIELWDTKAGAIRSTLALGGTPTVSALAFGSQNAELAVGLDESGTVAFFDLGSGKRKARNIEVRSKVMSLSYSPDGKRLAIGTSHTGFTVAEPATGRKVGPPADLADGTAAMLSWSPDNSMLAVSRGGPKVAVYHPSTLKPIATLESKGNVSALAWGPGSAALAVLHVAGDIELWDVASRTRTASLSSAVRGAVHVAWMDQGRFLVVGGPELVQVVRVSDGTSLSLDRAGGGSGAPVFVAGDGRFWCDDAAAETLVFRLGDDLLSSPLMVGGQPAASLRSRDILGAFFSAGGTAPATR